VDYLVDPSKGKGGAKSLLYAAFGAAAWNAQSALLQSRLSFRNGIITSVKACVLLLSEKEFQNFRKGIVRPQSMVSEVRPVRGGKSPRSLAVKLTGVTAHNLPSTKSAKKQAAQKKRPCKWDEAMEKGYMSPKKRDHRTFGGKRVTSTGLAGALKRQANNAVQCKREVILLEAQIADLPRNNPHHGGGVGELRTPSLMVS
jgi:hypothetical protein